MHQVHLGFDGKFHRSEPVLDRGPKVHLAQARARGVFEFFRALDKDRRGLPVAPEVEGDDGLIAEPSESDPEFQSLLSEAGEASSWGHR